MTETARKIGFSIIDKLGVMESDQFLDWCKKQPFVPEYFNGRLTSRSLVWWGREITNYGSSSVSWREAPEFPQAIRWLADQYYPDANSCLLYHYLKGKGIGVHRDKGCEPLVVSLNLLDCPRDLFGEKEFKTNFQWGISSYSLADGAVVRFNSFVEHAVKPVPCDRYSLQLRVVK